ncbi:hypothetical protein V8E53_001767 [Lactarius tabidus]
MSLYGPTFVNLETSYGAVFVGQLFNTLLTGLELVQTWLYCCNYWNKDSKQFKLFLGSLIVLDILSTISGSYSLYWYLVLNFGNVDQLEYRIWAKTLQTVLTAIPGAAVQLYYTRQIYLVSHSMICPIVVVPVILGSALLVLGLNAKAAVLKIDSHFHVSPWFLGAWMGVTVLIDVFITVMMSWALYRKRTGFKKTDSMIMTLMAYTINSGFLVTVLGIGMTISFAVAPGSLIWVAFSFVMSKCYINSLLAMLNSRDYVRNRSTTTTDNRDSAHNVSSFRIGSSSEAWGSESKSRQPGVTVTLHRSSASDFERRISEHAIGPIFEDPKPGSAL